MSRAGTTEPKIARYKLGQLQPGDILLSTDPDSSESKAIRVATRSLFSHASIYDGDFNFYEAVDDGVVNFNYLRFGIFSKENVRVLRLKPSITDHSSVARSAAKAAEKYREREYWTPGAVASIFRLSVPNREGGLFCSFLVAQSYEDAGFELCKNLRPREVHPGDILRSENLEDLTDEVVVDLPAWDKRSCLIDCSNPVDSECRDTPLIRLTFAKSMILREVRALFDNAGLPTPPTLDDALMSFIGDKNTERQANLDIALATILEKHRYSELPSRMASPILSKGSFEDDRTTWKEVPIAAVDASIAAHKHLRQKWMQRASGWRAQAQLADLAFLQGQLRCLRLHYAHCLAHAEVSEEGVHSIDLYIRALEKFCDERKATSAGGC